MEDNKRIENAEETTQSLKGGSSFREKLRRDNSWIGLLIGLGCPAVIFGILSGLLAIIENYTGKIDVINIQKIILLSIIPNLFILRY
ncbi:hypothetical protein LJC67_07870, partial [Bacteroidales bacterium OttesenSCG-928-A14]|nr:hypothetical protein [Bacteroidales bacterium OttesenSCG-928-A14]